MRPSRVRRSRRSATDSDPSTRTPDSSSRPETPHAAVGPESSITAAGGTATHHHAVGRDHRDHLAAEIGLLGIEMLRGVKRTLDPHGIMNPGVLVPVEPA